MANQDWLIMSGGKTFMAYMILSDPSIPYIEDLTGEGTSSGESTTSVNSLTISADSNYIYVTVNSLSTGATTHKSSNKIGIGVYVKSSGYSGQLKYAGDLYSRSYIPNYRISRNNLYSILDSLKIPISSIVPPRKHLHYKYGSQEFEFNNLGYLNYNLKISAFIVNSNNSHRFHTECNSINIIRKITNYTDL